MLDGKWKPWSRSCGAQKKKKKLDSSFGTGRTRGSEAMMWRNQESGSEAFFGIGFGTWSLGIDDVAESGIGQRRVFGSGFGIRSRGTETGSASEAFSEVFLGMGFS
jgi:hypothetical protein